jgi:hypothetical protein
MFSVQSVPAKLLVHPAAFGASETVSFLLVKPTIATVIAFVAEET